MKCPHDGTTLAAVSIAGVDLDKCHKCDGLWFDRGELERLRDSKMTEVEELLEQKYGDPQFEEGETDGYMRCPRCDDGRLQRYTYTYMHPVRIDRCSECLGLWLDDGELDAIIGEKEKLEEASQDARVRAFLRNFTLIFGKKK